MGAFLLCAERLAGLLGPLAEFFQSPPLPAFAASVDPSPAPGLPSLACDPGVVEDVIWYQHLRVPSSPSTSREDPTYTLEPDCHLLLKKGLFSMSSAELENASNEFSFCFILGDGAKTLPTCDLGFLEAKAKFSSEFSWGRGGPLFLLSLVSLQS